MASAVVLIPVGLAQTLVWHDLQPTREELVGLAYSPGKWTTMGSRGEAFNSSDGQVWSSAPGAPGSDIRSLASGVETRVAVGGSIFVETGTNWFQADNPTTQLLTDVAYGAGRFVAVGRGGTLCTSSDGSSWILGNPNTTNDLNAVFYQSQQFVAVGNAGTIVWSTNGIDWIVRESGVDWNLQSVGRVGRRFFVGSANGGILASEDSRVWTEGNVGTNSAAVVSIAGSVLRSVAICDTGKILFSDNGSDWLEAPPPEIVNHLNRVIYDQGRFVAVGNMALILTSSDGLVWTPETLGGLVAFQAVESVTFARNQFVAVGEHGTILTSSNGASWKPQASGVSFPLSEVQSQNGRFVASGPGTDVASAVGGILVSPDGISWLEAVMDKAFAVGSGDGEFIAEMPTGMFTSTDGTNWVRRTTNSVPSYAFAHGNGVYLGVGEGGTVFSSLNAVDWQTTQPTNRTFLRVQFHDGQFLGMGSEMLLRSVDGTVWSVLGHPMGWANEIAFGPQIWAMTTGIWVPPGLRGSSGAVLTSIDGRNWSPSFTLPDRPMLGIAYGNGRFVAVGYGTILVSEPVPSLSPQLGAVHVVSNGNIEIPLNIQAGHSFSIQTSEDLREWVLLSEGVATNDTVLVHDRTDGAPQRFYRISLP